MTANKSKDGAMRFTVAIKVRIGRQDIIDAIGWQYVTYGDSLPKTRRKALSLVRQARSKDGESIWTWQEDTLVVTPALWNSVAACVDGLFPELLT
jgi:hypothetical protein